MAASRKGHDKGSVKSHTDHTQVEEYDEVLNKYHQKSNAKVTKKRFLELQNVCYRKLEECEVIDFTRNLDECLKVCIDLHSKHSAEFRTTLNNFISDMNKISLELINLSYYEGAFTLLTKAKEVYHQYPRIVYPLNALDTLNNLSSCFIKFDHHHLASRTMEEARKLIFKEKLTEGTAATYINTCAVFSSMGKHVKAIENVQIGIQILEAEIGQIDSSVEDIEVFKILFVDKVRLLTLAYYSMATEALEMKLTDICHNFLYKALLCAKNFLVNEVNYDKLELDMKELMKRLYFEQNIQSKVFEKADAIKLKVFERKPKLKIVESETFDYESLNKNKDRVFKNSRPQVQKPYVNQTRQEQEKLRLFTNSVDTRRQSTEPKTLLKRPRDKTLQQSKEVNPEGKKLSNTTKNRQKLIPEISNLTDIIGDLSQVLVGAKQTNRKDVKFQSLAFIDPKQWVVIKKLCLDTKQDEMTLEKKIEKFNLLGKLKDMKRSNMAKKINEIEIQKGVNVQLTNSELRELMMKEEAKYQEQIIHIQKVFRKKNPPIADQINQLREKKVLEKGLYFRRVVKSVPVYNNKILLG